MTVLAEVDVLLLSRWQFALTIMFHYLFPPLTIGLGVVMAYLEGMHLWTKEAIYETAAEFWTRIFAATFAIGVATGIVMEFQFGTNWAEYSRFVGDVFGSPLAAEGIFAFFLESGFLSILVFGWHKVGPRFHFFATVMVALGSIFSSIWITAANSWQQTPAGHHVVQMVRDGQPWFVDGEPVLRAEIVDFWAMVFNPSSVHRLLHVWIGCFILGAAMVMSISAWYLLKDRHVEFARRSFRGGLLLATLSSLAAPISGHFQAQNVYRHQPAKLAAFEGHYNTGVADLSLFGIPDDLTKSVRAKLAIPGGLSWLVHHDSNAEVIGLDQIRPDQRPPVLLSFFSYHLMVWIGGYFVLLTLCACWLSIRGTLFDKRWLLWLFVVTVVPAFIANETGWVAAEVGRQPWVVYPPLATDDRGQSIRDNDGFLQYETEKGLRTSDGVSRTISSEQVLASIIMFGVTYFLLFLVWIAVLHHRIQSGPADDRLTGDEGERGIVSAAAVLSRHGDSMTETTQ